MSINWKLVADSPLVAKKTNLINGTAKVGREDSCDIWIKKNEVSRNHAQVEDRGGNIYIKDLGSANGTFINEVKLSGEAQVQNGDKVRFESITFIVEKYGDQQVNQEAGAASAATAVMQAVGNEAAAAQAATQMQMSVGTTHLSLVRGKCESGSRFGLDQMHSLIIGRAPTCDITLEDTTVSGEHAKLTLETSGWEITNLSATNGLFVNGNKIIKHMLKNEDLIELGASSFKYNSDDSGEDDAGDRKIPDWMRNQD